MSLVVRAFPLRSSVAELHAFASELTGARAAEAERFYRHYGADHESWHLQQTPNGPWVIAVTSLADPVEAAPRYAGATEAFHVWFKNQVLSLTGVDPNKAPLGPPTTQIFAWARHGDEPRAASPAAGP
ncbi:MAG TPA: hypothetical protein VMN79_11920 [Casimicrobiaceae bacterium]|nr:hypothetical protein [Casimicrobiaceae bacterium]